MQPGYNSISSVDEKMMARTLAYANAALDKGSVGIAALLSCRDEILDLEHNQFQETRDATDHAEMVILRRMARYLSQLGEEEKRELTLYSSLEPCLMCMAAISFAGLKRVVFSAYNADGTDEVTVARGLTSEQVNQALTRGPLTLLGGVQREEGREILARMGKLRASVPAD
ncbi:tRNA-specific adenosine deaminase [Ktedonobacter sp. SOSP1-52]|uniref:nucleoside deaminase n=1 Tax=Ktedonobacter sp. SOSP1-52 TaxID=2778366 RepID=UPI001915389E|nr:nucleoside deaminase [Ktedonobacter sp. SOSP1-52]GHO64887.1 tRNA-specific adenosine deaminase [Ktedonobacter sp. SOSP1-52]